MKKQKYTFETLSVASPCHVDWDSMHGDERVRFCDACERPVYNLTSLSGHEIAELIRQSEGSRRCVRFFRRRDGTILTRDCPVGFRAARRRAMGTVAAGLVAAFGGFASWFGWLGKKEPDGFIMGLVVAPEDLKILEEEDLEPVMGDLEQPVALPPPVDEPLEVVMGRIKPPME